MDRAVEIRLSKPEMTLHDALCAAGFVFSSTSSSPSYQRRRESKYEKIWSNDKNDEDSRMVDSDGVTLSKRKNQLSLRLRETTMHRSNNDWVEDYTTTTTIATKVKSAQQPPQQQQPPPPPPPPPRYEPNNSVNSGKTGITKTNTSIDQKRILPEEVISPKAVVVTRGRWGDGRNHYLDEQQQQQQQRVKKRRMINHYDQDDENEDFIKLIDTVLDNNNKKKRSRATKKKREEVLKKEFEVPKPAIKKKLQKDHYDDEMKIQKALSYYQGEVTPIIEACLKDAGFTVEQSSNPNSLTYVKFMECAAKSTLERMDLLRKTIRYEY